ncbi:hypothetical protein ISF6_5330 [Piscinibacter sakaiensis]|uniref:Cytochrome b561 bacterial/Ni-hydrogenase domain-containing protein n=2 Tax=Piscinibacter sakaiensis TaxID=1547922 RepID=A0A0K8P818_PISS1|nr:hypothetical protein ISF6_5330 [Piscinibacter sakaiensis]
MFHALFAASFTGAYLSADSESWRLLHVTLGSLAGALLLWRVVYGLVGPRHARLTLLGRRVAGLAAWLRGLASHRSGPGALARQGLPLAMGAVLVTLLALAVPLVLSGLGNDQGWGGAAAEQLLEEVHEFLGNTVLALVLAHLGLLALLGLLRRQNPALPMLSGRVPGSGPDRVTHDRAGLAVLLLLAALAFGAWQLSAAPGDAGAGTTDKGTTEAAAAGAPPAPARRARAPHGDDDD